jgi:hypothetical protein
MPPAGGFNEQGFGNDCLLIERRTAGDAKMGLSHGPQFDQRRRSAIGQTSPLRHLAHRHGRNLLGGLAVAIMVFAAAISMVTS